MKKQSPFPHIHTAFLHYTPLDVFNISLEHVKEDQIESRSLLKAFTIAAAKAQSLYGVCRFAFFVNLSTQIFKFYPNKF